MNMIRKIGHVVIKINMAIIALIILFYLHIYETKPIYLPLK
ncbi:hypothetical protein [Methanosphaera sp.]